MNLGISANALVKGPGKIVLLCLLFSSALLGCVTQVSTNAGSAPINFQSNSISPKNGGALIDESTLKVGDIFLTSTDSVASFGIRAASLAPVSHAAIYAGDGLIIEAVGKGVQTRSITVLLQEEAVVVAFRHPKATQQTGQAVKEFAQQQIGRPYNHMGILLQAPFTIERKLCELPLIPGAIRQACLTGIATVQMGVMRSDQFFCSQLVVAAYDAAKLPLISADPRFVSPADILHLREGDVSSMAPLERLVYLGHLKLSNQRIEGQST